LQQNSGLLIGSGHDGEPASVLEPRKQVQSAADCDVQDQASCWEGARPQALFSWHTVPVGQRSGAWKHVVTNQPSLHSGR